MKKSNKAILSIVGIITILLVTMGLSFAYFTANITGGEDATTITLSGGTMRIVYNGGEKIFANSISPKNEAFATKLFTVTGNSTLDLSMPYKISLVVEENTFSNEALKYKLISTNTDNNGVTVSNITNLTNIGTGSKTIELGIGEFTSPTNGNKVHTYNLELYFPETNTNQNIDQEKSFKAHVKTENTNSIAVLLHDEIINQGGGVDSIVARGIPNFAEISTSEDTGIYATEDDYGTSYYYRGIKKELNNNLIWAGFQWKIIRINGDGSIRLIYNGTEEQFNTNKIMNDIGLNTQIKEAPWNSVNVNDAKYVGFMYGGLEGAPSTSREMAILNETDSEIKTELDAWYKIKILDKNHANKVADNLFCNDRQLQNEVGGEPTGPGYGDTGVTTYFATKYRLIDNNFPTLKCGLQNDRFTVDDTTIGNGALTYPIGLITADEATIAGLKYGINNSVNYLHTEQNFHSFSPLRIVFDGNENIAVVEKTGDLVLSDIKNKFGLRPTISINSSTRVIGSGTSTDPYKVV